MKNCYIVGSRECKPYIINDEESLIIAADAGYKTLLENGIIPHIILGDFDTLPPPSGFDNIVIHPKEKDDTDTFLAVKTGIENNCKNFYIYGGTGGREDHTYANLQILSYLSERNLNGFLLYEDMAATIINNSSLVFNSFVFQK